LPGELLRIGPIDFYTYGTYLAAAFLAGTGLAILETKRLGLDRHQVTMLAAWLMGLGLVVGRLGYIMPDLGYYLANALEIFIVGEGGLSYLPALVAGMIFTHRFARKNGISPPVLFDRLAPCLALGLVVSSLGTIEPTLPGAIIIGNLYWPPPLLLYFTIEFAGLWYLAVGKKSFRSGSRFKAVLLFDAAARLTSSMAAWWLHRHYMPFGLSITAALIYLAAVVGFYDKWIGAAGAAQGAQHADESGKTIGMGSPAGYRKNNSKVRLGRTATWCGIYILFVLFLSRSI